jgi:hypothetical protein
MLRFVKNTDEKFKFFSSISLEDKLKGTPIIAAGFPKQGVGDIFITEGIISQINVDERGIFGTSALQSSGMSGGPVVLKENGSLIGIIVGATFDASTGAPASYGVLAMQEIGPTLGIRVDPTAPRRDIAPTAEQYEPQHEGLLRGAINALAEGVCSETMGVLLRTQCQAQMPDYGNIIKQRGPILSTKFAGIQPSPMGNCEVYTVTFKNVKSVWMINTTPDGKMLVFWGAN